MRLKPMLLVIASGVLVLLTAGVVAVRSIDVNQYRTLIAAQVKAATGRELTITGPLHVALGFSPALVATDLSFANAPGGSRPAMIAVRRLEVQVALLPLLLRRLVVRRLVLIEPDILLETNARGVGNWVLGAAASPAIAGQELREAGGDLPALTVLKVRIVRGVLRYRSGQTDRTTTLTLDRLELEAKDLTSPVALDVAGAYSGEAFTLTGTVGPLAELPAPSRPYPVALTLQAGGTTADLRGTIAAPLQAQGFALTLAAHGPDLGPLAQLAGQTVPAFGPFAVTTHVTGAAMALSLTGIDARAGTDEQGLVTVTGAVQDVQHGTGMTLGVRLTVPDPQEVAKRFGTVLSALPPFHAAFRVQESQGVYAVADLTATLGTSTLTGRGTVQLNGPRPQVTAVLSSTRLDLTAPVSPGPVANGRREVTQPALHRFLAAPIPVSALRLADVDVELSADHVVLPDRVPLDVLRLHVVLVDGHLTVEPLTAGIGGGTVSGRVALVATGSQTATLAGRVEGRGVGLGKVLAAMGQEGLVAGTPLTFNLDLGSHGSTARELLGRGTGHLVVVLGPGQIHAGFLDWLGADLLTQVADKLTPQGRGDQDTHLTCGVIGFTATDGIAQSDHGIAFETSKMTLVSSGGVNLRDGAIDFSVRPEGRGVTGLGAGALVTLLRVQGTLQDPQFGVNGMAVAETAVTIGAAMATGGLSWLAGTLLHQVTVDRHPCATARARLAATAQPTSRIGIRAEGAKFGRGIEHFFQDLVGR